MHKVDPGSIVSIPVGFSSPLQPNGSRLAITLSAMFQSLSGFQVRCNSISLFSFSYAEPSFNPCRVFKSAATCPGLSPGLCPCYVSIPVGFSSPLQLSGNDVLILVGIELFQSLSGFQVRCNIEKARLQFRQTLVSIPVGFSSPLQRKALALKTRL